MTQPGDPEFRALHEAFAAQAARAGIPPLDAGTLPAIRRRVSRRRALGVVLAAVVLALAVAVPVAGLSGRPVRAVPAELNVPKPPDGWRWESFRGVMAAVPASWGYDFAPGPDWCAREKFPAAPYVDLTHGDAPTLAIGCIEAPSFQEQTHLSFTLADAAPPWGPGMSGWEQKSRTVGDVRVTVVAAAADQQLAERILATARTLTPDQHGCPMSIPDAPAVPLASLDQQPLAVCQYGDDGLLTVSAALPDAAAAWSAMLGAPAGGGPDSPASGCDPSSDTKSALVLLAGAERTPIRMVVGHCRGNGLADAGGLRAITAPLCHAVLQPPVVLWSGTGPSAELCVGVAVETPTPGAPATQTGPPESGPSPSR